MMFAYDWHLGELNLRAQRICSYVFIFISSAVIGQTSPRTFSQPLPVDLGKLYTNHK